MEGASELFERGSLATASVFDEAKVEVLHAKIGELTVANGKANMRDVPGITVFL